MPFPITGVFGGLLQPYLIQLFALDRVLRLLLKPINALFRAQIHILKDPKLILLNLKSLPVLT